MENMKYLALLNKNDRHGPIIDWLKITIVFEKFFENDKS